MPLPTIAGVFGIARTMRSKPPSHCAMSALRVPAAIDSTQPTAASAASAACT